MPPGVSLSPLERRIAAQLGAPLATVEQTLAHLDRGKALLGELRTAAGFRPQHHSWLTTRNKKMQKGQVASAGLTINAATSALASWGITPPELQGAYATILGRNVGDLEALLTATTCSCSSKCCRGACSAEQSLDSQKPVNVKVRLIRTLMMMTDPAAAYALSVERLSSLVRLRGSDGVRLRMNVSDDLRHEYLCPALLTSSCAAYAYTKHRPTERPEVAGLTVVYSATEHWTLDDIVDLVSAGHRVAVPVDVRFGRAMPSTFHGLPLIDGDLDDDLTRHPHSVVIGLRGRSRDRIQRQELIEAGFIWPVA